MLKLLQLSVCVITVIQLTSSQSTYDVIQQEYDVNSCGRTEQVLNQLMTDNAQLYSAVALLYSAVSQTQIAVSQLLADNSQLRSDLAKVKAAVVHGDVTGKLGKQKM